MPPLLALLLTVLDAAVALALDELPTLELALADVELAELDALEDAADADDESPPCPLEADTVAAPPDPPAPPVPDPVAALV